MAPLIIAGRVVDHGAASTAVLVDLVRAARGGTLTDASRAAVERVSPGLVARLDEGRCGAVAVNLALEIAALAGHSAELVARLVSILCEGDASAAVRTVQRGRFRVHYQTEGRCRVPPDAGGPEPITLPGDPAGRPLALLEPGEVPTYVQRLLFWLEHAWRVFPDRFGLDPPPGDEPLEVCVTCGAWGAAAGRTIFVASALGHDLLCCVAVHELFHVFQDFGRMRGEWTEALYEGGAVLAEDAIADAVNRYLYLASLPSGLLAAPEQSVRTASYHASLLWRYIGEQAERRAPASSGRAFTAMLECSTGGPDVAGNLERAAARLFGHGFHRFRWREAPGVDPITTETVYGNFALACYLDAAADPRFRLVERGDAITFAALMGREPVALPAVPVRTICVDATGDGAVWADQVDEFGRRYYEVDARPGVAALDLTFHAGREGGPASVQVVRLDAGGQVSDINRFEGSTYRKWVPISASERIVVIVASPGPALRYHLAIRPAPESPDVMITRAGCAPGTEYERESRPEEDGSPDLWIEDAADTPAAVVAGIDNRLVVRAHNRSGVGACEVWVDLDARVAGTGPDGWQPIRDSLGVVQSLRVSIAPRSAGRWTVMLFPPESATAGRLQVRASLVVPDDPNTDNKTAIVELEVRS